VTTLPDWQPKLRLSRLRDIGWSLWDPIGLLAKGANWEGLPFADEYDAYLIDAAGQLRRNAPKAVVVDNLVKIETDHMQMTSADARERATAVVDAILNDRDLWALPGSG
jgi:hypothetical protein